MGKLNLYWLSWILYLNKIYIIGFFAMSVELKDCPFCGSSEIEICEYELITQVICECGCRSHGLTEDIAINKWNTRAEPAK